MTPRAFDIIGVRQRAGMAAGAPPVGLADQQPLGGISDAVAGIAGRPGDDRRR